MQKAHPVFTPFIPKGEDEKLLGREVPYLSAIGALEQYRT
jgi:hypothetical protein